MSETNWKDQWNEKVPERIRSSFVFAENGCLEWTGRLSSGYGMVGFNKKNWGTHRLVWTLLNGEVPKKLYICHKCDNRKCANPDHLFIGTPSQNMANMVAKGRGRNQLAGFCKRGHQFTEENTHRYKTNRACKTCIAMSRERSYLYKNRLTVVEKKLEVANQVISEMKKALERISSETASQYLSTKDLLQSKYDIAHEALSNAAKIISDGSNGVSGEGAK
jgi:hypothetical protein